MTNDKPPDVTEVVWSAYQHLKDLELDEFRLELAACDDHVLADMRPLFGWNPVDPSQSAPQTRAINRDLRHREQDKERRIADERVERTLEAQQKAISTQRIGIAISCLIAFGALVVAILSFLSKQGSQ